LSISAHIFTIIIIDLPMMMTKQSCL